MLAAAFRGKSTFVDVETGLGVFDGHVTQDKSHILDGNQPILVEVINVKAKLHLHLEVAVEDTKAPEDEVLLVDVTGLVDVEHIEDPVA